MIRAYVGLLGQGKTLSMVNDACDLLLKNKRVFTNTPFAIPDPKDKQNIFKAIYCNGSDFNYAFRHERDALFCVDEASIFWSNYDWNKMDFELLIRFAQSRKYGLDIFYTSQGFKHTIKRLRDLTNEVVKCKKTTMPFFGDFYTNIYYDPEFFDKIIVNKQFEKEYILKRKIITPNKAKKLYNYYNTIFTVVSSGITAQTVEAKQQSIDTYETEELESYNDEH